jgi:hypothetical protein
VKREGGEETADWGGEGYPWSGSGHLFREMEILRF